MAPSVRLSTEPVVIQRLFVKRKNLQILHVFAIGRKSKMSVSDLDICNLAFEGNLVKLQEKIEEKKELKHAKDQVVICNKCFIGS